MSDAGVAALEANLARSGAEEDVLRLVSSPRPSRMAPADCAVHIRSLYGLARTLGSAIEAQVMEACWRIETGAPDDFEALIATTPLTPARARRYAACWEAARGNRAVLDLATDRPAEAVRLVSEVAEAMDAGDVDDAVGAEVARIVALPRRRRTAALRELVERRDARLHGQRPEDFERIAALERDVEALDAERTKLLEERHPAREWREIEEALRGAADVVEDSAARMRRQGGRPPASRRKRLLSSVDAVVAAADDAAGLLQEDE